MTSRAPQWFEVVDAQLQKAPAVAVRGEVDIAAVPALQSALDGAIRDSAGAFVLDLCEVEFLDSSGLHLILRARALLAREDRTLHRPRRLPCYGCSRRPASRTYCFSTPRRRKRLRRWCRRANRMSSTASLPPERTAQHNASRLFARYRRDHDPAATGTRSRPRSPSVLRRPATARPPKSRALSAPEGPAGAPTRFPRRTNSSRTPRQVPEPIDRSVERPAPDAGRVKRTAARRAALGPDGLP